MGVGRTLAFTLGMAMVLAGGFPLAATAKDKTGGHTSGNGGYFCRQGNEAPVPCDFFFERREYKLPYLTSQWILHDGFRDEVKRELKVISELIERRSLGHVKIFEQIPVREILIYNTPTFLGDDLQYLGPEIEARQVGYAYWFNKVSAADTSTKETVRIIEIDMTYLDGVEPRNQAYAILHEYLHFLPGLDHAVISPFIRALHAMLRLHDEQASGARRLLTDDELRASRDFQGYLAHLGAPRFTSADSDIHPNGGGLIVYSFSGKSGKGEVARDNFVGVGAALKRLNAGEAYYLHERAFTDEVTEVHHDREYRWAEEGSLFAGYDRTTGLEGSTFDNAIVKGSFSPLRKCLKYDAKGVCEENVTWLPVEVELRQGDESKLQRLAISIYKRGDAGKFLNNGDEDVRCDLHLGVFELERLRGNAGTETSLSVLKLNCETAIDIVEKGNVRLLAHMGLSGGPMLLFDLVSARSPHFESPRFPGSGKARGLGLRGDASVGVEIAKRLSVMAYGKASTMGDFLEPGAMQLSRGRYGVRLTIDVTKNLFLQGHYERGGYLFETETTESGVNGERKEIDYQSFGIGLGGRFDIRGPYKKP